MKIFFIISSFFVISFFFFIKDKTEEPKEIEVQLDKNVFFFATANIGREYLGAAHDLDRAWKDRFTGGIYELDYLPQNKEQELLQVRVPHVSEDDARRITEFAKKIRDLYKAEELKTSQKRGQQNYQLLWSFFLQMFLDINLRILYCYLSY